MALKKNRMSSAKLNSTDTICAQATAPGRGGIAIVRLSGPAVKSITQLFFGRELPFRQAVYLPFGKDHTDAIDEGVAIFFPGPNSFTGEDVLELHGHGSPVVVDAILQRLLSLGARLARPGEFSERAFLNGKMDLAQAEAIADLIDAQSQQSARLALRSLQGEFSQTINALTEKVTRLRMYLEAAIDFSDEEIDFLTDDHVQASFTDIIQTLNEISQHAKQGSLLREGITVVLAGKPNVGKSSLLNELSGKESAIVTSVPGTTRDVLREHILMDDIPLHVIDTAGLRESDDVVELEGMRRAYAEIAKADLLLHVISAEDSTSSLDNELIAREAVPAKKIIVRNKIDLTKELPSIEQVGEYTMISISAKQGVGLDLLKAQIKSLIGFEQQEEGIFLARRRHLDALSRARVHIEEGLRQLTNTQHAELTAEDLRLAQLALSEITGEFTADDLLGRIFSSFCIGK